MPLEYQEPRENLPPLVQDQHRAIASLVEELEAAQWYNERATCCNDPQLKAVIEHHRGEEVEHAAMLMEWLRRNFPGFDEEMRTYLFTDADITAVEEEASEEPGISQQATAASLNIGSLK